MTKVEVDIEKIRIFLNEFTDTLEEEGTIVERIGKDMTLLSQNAEKTLQLMVHFFELMGIPCEEKQ
jgi:hypothetical protein